MQKLLKDYLDDFNKKQKKNRRAAIAAVLLVVMVVGGVLDILTQYGIAMTGAPVCGQEEHVHEESCYASVLSCGQEETEGHTHTEDCLYPEELVCGEEEGEEHTHSDGCYGTPDGYACGQEESEGHTHSDGCCTSELTCGQEEHVHTDACYAAEEDADTASKSTEAGEDPGEDLITEDSGKEDGAVEDVTEDSDGTDKDVTEDSDGTDKDVMEEPDDADKDMTAKPGEEDTTADPDHAGVQEDGTAQDVEKPDGETEDAQPDADGTEEPSGDEEEEDGPDPEADLESREIWDEQYADVEWQDAWGEDLVTAAKLQIGYAESEENYVVADDESHKGYTRYGHFADENSRYMDWDAAFVNFCLYYAGISNSGLFPEETDTAEWRNRFEEIMDEVRGEEESYLTGPDGYEPEAGDLVFFAREGEETEEQMGIVSSREEETGEITVIEGNCGNEVQENTYDAADHQITAYLKLTELEAAYKDILTPEEQQQVDAVIAMIEALPGREAIMERFAALEEDEEGCAAYNLGLLEQVRAARAAYEALNGKQKAAVWNAEKLLQYDWLLTDIMEEEKPAGDIPEYMAHVPVEGSARGEAVLELLYGDEKHQTDKKWEENHPGYGFTANIALYTQNIEGTKNDLDLTVTIHVPKPYINPGSIKFKPLGQTIEHEISAVKETDEDYEISIRFPKYAIGRQMSFPFEMNFYGGIVPADYELKVYATLSIGDKSDDTGCNRYRPVYVKPNIVKYVNTNQYDSMAEDHTRVSASIGEDGVIKDSDYVSFWYKMGGERWYMREYDQVTLTDTLPTYEKYVRNPDGSIKLDENGQEMTETAIAEFDPSVNEGWILGEDGKTVSRVLTTERTCTVPCKEDDKNWRAANHLEDQIKKEELKLKFPDCIIDEKANDGFLKKDLVNQVEAEFRPRDPSEAETVYTTEDDIIFTLTNQPTGAGFAKYNSSNVVTDIQQVREGLYRWGIKLENTESVVPMKKIVLTDFALDERLKISTLWLNTGKEEYKANNRIDRIEAVTYDGETDIYRAPSSLDESIGPWFEDRPYSDEMNWWYQELVLEPGKEYKSFTVYMKDDYELKLGENIHIGVYTTFRQPDEKQYVPSDDRDDPRNTYHNMAQAQYWVGNIMNTLISENMFSMIGASENIWIEKNIVYGNKVELGEKNKFWNFHIKGSLEDDKAYEDIRIIDLLPEAFTLPRDDKNEFKIEYGNGGGIYVKDTLIIENYKNTGRIAVILYLDADKVKETLGRKDADGNSEVSITMKTEVLPTASLGTCTNDVWLVSEDFEDGETLEASRTGKDIYDMDDDGDTKDLVRTDADWANVTAAKGIMVEKLIAPADQNTWRRSSLFLGVGDRFRYKLCVSNMLTNVHSGLVVSDVLPVTGDRNISNTGNRDSEYAVKLSDKITPLEGYEVFYTTSAEVYNHSMTDILGEKDTPASVPVEWISSEDMTPGGLEEVTAFQIVAKKGVEIGPDERVEFEIPVKVTATLSDESYKILETKSSEDRNNGTAAYLVSTNSFGYRVDTLGGRNLESNYVRAEIPFAGFVIRKVDAGETDKGLAGAEFRLEKQQSADTGGNEAEAGEGTPEELWTTVAGCEKATTGTDGALSFRNLTPGTYRLIETKSPAGYNLDPTPIPVTITLNRSTMEYSIVIEGNSHAGNSKDPFVIINHASYELPSTGGAGAESYALAGTILMMAAVGLLYRRKSRAEVG